MGEVPPPQRIAVAFGTFIIDGTVCPVWDWRSVPDLYSGKAGAGMNVQIAANLDGAIAAVGPEPVPEPVTTRSPSPPPAWPAC